MLVDVVENYGDVLVPGGEDEHVRAVLVVQAVHDGAVHRWVGEALAEDHPLGARVDVPERFALHQGEAPAFVVRPGPVGPPDGRLIDEHPPFHHLPQLGAVIDQQGAYPLQYGDVPRVP